MPDARRRTGDGVMDIRLAATVLCAVFWGLQAGANTLSVDCSRTQIWAEQEICRKPALMRLDVVDLALFRTLRASGGLSEPTRADHRAAFLAGREACQSDTPCLESAYRRDLSWLAAALGAVDAKGGYWAVATDGTSTAGLTLRRKASANAKALEVIAAEMPVQVLEQTNTGWWQVRSLTTGVSGWVPRSKAGRATLTYQPQWAEDDVTPVPPLPAAVVSDPVAAAPAATPPRDMVDRAEYDAKLAEIAALTAALVDSQSRIDALKRQVAEVLAAMSFCTADPECANAMGLQP
ncbi:MAG: hypothetical protein CFE34_05760 [Rhodobacteraceae bacterium PARR1]|nr:MAG: hypothetical protein CFE34_05760 [Rhodobacteraceae bacterium PARR1]